MLAMRRYDVDGAHGYSLCTLREVSSAWRGPKRVKSFPLVTALLRRPF